jgi:osmotically-inducible protein OsmY
MKISTSSSILMLLALGASAQVNSPATTPRVGVQPSPPQPPPTVVNPSGSATATRFGSQIQGGTSVSSNPLAAPRFSVTASNRLQLVATNVSVFVPTNLAKTTNLLPRGTNIRFAVTNTAVATTNALTFRDQGLSEQDKTLVTTIRQRIESASTFEPFAQTVHFISRDGLVTIVGTVPTAADRSSLVTFVQGVPGVQRVLDRLRVSPTVAFQTSGTAGTSSGVLVTEGTAPTPADQALLAQIRQTVQTQVIVSEPAAPAVQVSVQNGAVTLAGTATTVEERAKIAASVQRVAGVTRVNNQIQINANAATQTQAGVAFTNLPPTGRTNLSRPGFTNLPPGLQKRMTLPPGLQNRETLPPGLEKRTNTSTFPPSANP